MNAPRNVRLFRNGRNQAVCIPREFELPGEEALIHREGKRLVIEPKPARRTLHEVLDALEPIPDFPDIEDSPPEPRPGER
jgi:antitoxin VapB